MPGRARGVALARRAGRGILPPMNPTRPLTPACRVGVRAQAPVAGRARCPQRAASADGGSAPPVSAIRSLCVRARRLGDQPPYLEPGGSICLNAGGGGGGGVQTHALAGAATVAPAPDSMAPAPDSMAPAPDSMALTSGYPLTGQVRAGFLKMPAGLGEVPAGLWKVRAGLGRVPAGLGRVPAGLGRVRAGLGEEPAGLGEVPAGLGQVPAGLGEVPAGLGEVPAGLGQMPAGLGQMPAGLGRVRAGLGRVRGGFSTRRAGFWEMRPGAPPSPPTLPLCRTGITFPGIPQGKTGGRTQRRLILETDTEPRNQPK